MATQKKEASKVSSTRTKVNSLKDSKGDINYDKIKEEVVSLLTGQDPNRKGDFDYVAMVKRVTVILIAVYGVSRVSILRRLAFSIVSSYITNWVAKQAAQNLLPKEMQMARG
jgi:hypothetical protein